MNTSHQRGEGDECTGDVTRSSSNAQLLVDGLAVERWTVGHAPSGSIRSKSNSQRVFDVAMGQGLLCGGRIKRDGRKVVKRCGFSVTRSTTPFSLSKWWSCFIVPTHNNPSPLRSVVDHGLAQHQKYRIWSSRPNRASLLAFPPLLFEFGVRGCQFGYT